MECSYSLVSHKCCAGPSVFSQRCPSVSIPQHQRPSASSPFPHTGLTPHHAFHTRPATPSAFHFSLASIYTSGQLTNHSAEPQKGLPFSNPPGHSIPVCNLSGSNPFLPVPSASISSTTTTLPPCRYPQRA